MIGPDVSDRPSNPLSSLLVRPLAHHISADTTVFAVPKHYQGPDSVDVFAITRIKCGSEGDNYVAQ